MVSPEKVATPLDAETVAPAQRRTRGVVVQGNRDAPLVARLDVAELVLHVEHGHEARAVGDLARRLDGPRELRRRRIGGDDHVRGGDRGQPRVVGGLDLVSPGRVDRQAGERRHAVGRRDARAGEHARRRDLHRTDEVRVDVAELILGVHHHRERLAGVHGRGGRLAAGRDHELGRRGRGDLDPGGRRGRELAVGRLEGVTGADLVERQAAEGGQASGGGHGGRAAQDGAARVVQDRERDVARQGGGVAELVLGARPPGRSRPRPPRCTAAPS